MDDLEKMGHLFYADSSFLYIFIAIVDFKLALRVQKRPIWVKIDGFVFAPCDFKILTGHLKKQYGTSHEQHQA